ncbi:MFS transporter [Neobacillus sp. LXY-4]|uniref:MFS transporter n=1 Tax=Neobacillus sp. LXY-4 TaxID=3379826 RepID=UPI003EE09280
MNSIDVIGSRVQDRVELRNLILYSTGKTISIFGTAIYNFALGLNVLKLTGSPFSFAITLILGVLPMVIIFPFAGVLADRFDKKTMVVSMDLLSGLLLVVVYMLTKIVDLDLMLIYATTFLLTVFSTFFGVGLEAAKPNMVSQAKLMDINTISKIIDSGASILGPMLGGIVYSLVDIEPFIIFNGISFILSGVSILFIDFRLFHNESKAPQQVGELQVFKDIKEGFLYLRNRKSIIGFFMVLISVNFFLGYAVTVPLPFIINSVLHLDPKEFGLIQAAFPVGMMIGAIFIKKIMRMVSYRVLLRYICFFLAMLMVLSGIPVMLQGLQINHLAYTAIYGVLMFLFGVTVALIDLPIAYIIQTEVPDEFRGRVLSIGVSIGKTMLPIAMIISGALLNLIPSFLLPISGGVLFLIFIFRSGVSKKLKLDSEKV